MNNLPNRLPPGTTLVHGLAKRCVQPDGVTTHLLWDSSGIYNGDEDPMPFCLSELHSPWQIENSFEKDLIEIVETAE